MNKDMFTEIIALKKSQDALRVSELRYRRLFESAKDGILILNAETGNIIDVNPFLVELLGYSRDQFLDKTIWDIGFFRDIIANQENFLELRENKYIRYEDRPLETADGRKVDVEFVSNVYQEGDHNVIQCNIRDITERKRAASTSATERERLAVTLRSIGDGVITTDTQGNIDIMNTVAEKLCGWYQNEAHGKPLFSVFNSIDEISREPHENSIEKVLATGKIFEPVNHVIIISKDGTERTIANRAAPIKDKNNKILGVVLVFRDITEKQKLLENSQRYQKLESLGVLAGGIAHDFNNLLGGIFGYIDLIRSESKEMQTIEYLDETLKILNRARALTRQLLTFAKGGAPIRKITSLIPGIRETAQFALSGSNVLCRYEIMEDLWSCNIDMNQICQVIDNIIINAQQAMPSGGTIELSAKNISMDANEHQTLPKGSYVKISIKDHGIGISKKILPCIFDPFFTTKSKGHGLGLATCYSIINRHGGAIDVESVPDEGSTFHLYIPASKDSTCKEVAIDDKHTGRGKIIVMDDEEFIRKSLKLILETLGYSVICTNDGKETLNCLVEETKMGHALTAIILDLTIPGGMGGKETLLEIRKLNTKIPVFVTSGYAEDTLMSDPADYGFTDSICKPYTIAELSKMLNKHLK